MEHGFISAALAVKVHTLHGTATVWRRNTDGTSSVLVNTFESDRGCAGAEGYPVRPRPGAAPIYCVGPLVGGDDTSPPDQGRGERHGCLAWLDAQPKSSVVFLCFGSRGTHTHPPRQSGRSSAAWTDPGIDSCGSCGRRPAPFTISEYT
ncbi:anthocyanidin 5,3-O-glucosyltransferase-like [Panicum miliaceum]|uniref:Anthocyanidin 5,3-O-glucosyltransferase-like n=1 Tax=Panicum miliaceum TaxID=4540 RepID=A0A3L6SRT1_PANMI|nr:anthocyanidin 5,3-O-glucosyltransferase-like [Panicum miliaceum]